LITFAALLMAALCANIKTEGYNTISGVTLLQLGGGERGQMEKVNREQ